MLRSHDIGSLVDFSLLTRRHDVATSRRWNVAMLRRHDVAASFSPASSFQLQIAKNHLFTYNSQEKSRNQLLGYNALI